MMHHACTIEGTETWHSYKDMATFLSRVKLKQLSPSKRRRMRRRRKKKSSWSGRGRAMASHRTAPHVRWCTLDMSAAGRYRWIAMNERQGRVKLRLDCALALVASCQSAGPPRHASRLFYVRSYARPGQTFLSIQNFRFSTHVRSYG